MDNAKKGLAKCVKQVLESELSRDDKFMEEDIIKQLLSDETSDTYSRDEIVGYPTYPLYRELGKMFDLWTEKGYCPVGDLPKYDTLDEQKYVESREAVFKTITPTLQGLQSLWDIWTPDERNFRVREIMVILGLRGLLDLLGVRKTVGSREILPPSRMVMLQSFTQKHSPKADISVGARALAKHFHRDQSGCWWGKSTGTEADKNIHALTIFNKILDGATWINIHWLPQDVIICEVRQENGYGARWSPDGKEFRGFLEPHVVDGHTVGWKH